MVDSGGARQEREREREREERASERGGGGEREREECSKEQRKERPNRAENTIYLL